MSTGGQLDRNVSANSPTWTPRAGSHIFAFGESQALVASRGLEIRPNRRFTLGGVFRFPSQNPGTPAGEILMFSGKSLQLQAGAPVTHGLLPTWNGSSLHIRLGDGTRDLYDVQVSADKIRPGAVHLVSLSWEGWAPQGTPANRLSLTLDGEVLGTWTLLPTHMPPEALAPLTLMGRAVDERGGLFRFEGSGVRTESALVSPEILPAAELYREYQDQIRNWSR